MRESLRTGGSGINQSKMLTKAGSKTERVISLNVYISKGGLQVLKKRKKKTLWVVEDLHGKGAKKKKTDLYCKLSKIIVLRWGSEGFLPIIRLWLKQTMNSPDSFVESWSFLRQAL